MGSYEGGHNASRPQTNRWENNDEEPKQKRRLGTVVVVVMLFSVHGKHLRSCREGQLT